MEPCSDSSDDEDLKKFQKKFMKASKHFSPVDTSYVDDDYGDQSEPTISQSRKPKNIDNKKNKLTKNIVNKSKHKHFDKDGDDIFESESEDDDNDEDDEDDEDDEEDEMEKKMVLDRMKKSVYEDGVNDDQEDDESEEDIDPYASIRKELVDMSFEEKQRLRNKLGAKIYNQIVHSEKTKKIKHGHSQYTEELRNGPVEISAKKRVPYLRKVVQIKRKMNRDPRFDDLSGEFKEDQFKRSYGFLDEMKKKEKETIENAVRAEKDRERKSELKALANRYKQIEETKKRKEKKDLLLNKWKEKEKELVKQGKKPYFLKQSDVKKLELAEMYKELKSKGSLENYMAKKRKKNASKEKKKFHS